MRRAQVKSAIVFFGLCASGASVEASPYVQTDLVSDIPNLASLTDAQLKNPWGISHNATSPFWTSNQLTNSATLYMVTGATTVSKVNINPPQGFVSIPTTAPPQGPTGQVANSNTTAFQIVNGGNGQSARFIFANLNGTISAWNGGLSAITQVTTAGAVYTGLAINASQTRLYAANGAGTGRIDVFDSSFQPIALGAGAFTDPNLPAGFVPFNVQDIGGKLYVTYAPAGRASQTTATAGMGVVSVFDESGNFQEQLISGSALAAPWGIALAPAGFGEFANDLLVGNFSFVDSAINAFDPITGALEGTIPINVGAGNTPGGLWALEFGNGGNGGDVNTLYFTAGINGERDGLFAAISVPEPSSLALFAAALLTFYTVRRRPRGLPASWARWNR